MSNKTSFAFTYDDLELLKVGLWSYIVDCKGQLEGDDETDAFYAGEIKRANDLLIKIS